MAQARKILNKMMPKLVILFMLVKIPLLQILIIVSFPIFGTVVIVNIIACNFIHFLLFFDWFVFFCFYCITQICFCDLCFFLAFNTLSFCLFHRLLLYAFFALCK